MRGGERCEVRCLMKLGIVTLLVGATSAEQVSDVLAVT